MSVPPSVGAIHLTVPVAVEDRPPVRALALVMRREGEVYDIVLASDDVEDATDRWLTLLESETDLGDPICVQLDTVLRVSDSALEAQVGTLHEDAVALVRRALDGVVFADRIGVPIADPATDPRAEADRWLVQQHAALRCLGEQGATRPSLRERVAALTEAAGAMLVPARMDLLEVLSSTQPEVVRPRPAELVIVGPDREALPDLRSRLVVSPGRIDLSLRGLPEQGSVVVWAVTADGEMVSARAELTGRAVNLVLPWPDADPPTEMVLALWR